MDTLDAAFAVISVLEAGSASFDQASVQHLVSQAMNLEFGVLGEVFIRNLSVAYAQMVGAAIGNLCVKASDGSYYEIDVGPDGLVTATPATVTEQEIDAGQTTGGRAILETDIAAANLTTTSLLATYALVNRIDAARIDVDQLFAREAFIDRLETSVVQGSGFIELRAAADGAQAAAKEASARLDSVVRVEPDGLHVMGCALNDGVRTYNGSEVRIDQGGLSVLLNGYEFSRFAGNYAQFGDYRLRRTRDNGLAFNVVSSGQAAEEEEAE